MADYQELRRLAEQATPGPWRRTPAVRWRVVKVNEEEATEFTVADASINRLDENAEADAAYIAAANPAAILSLLDELEHKTQVAEFCDKAATAAEQRVAALEEGLRRLTDEYWDRHGQEVRGQRIGDDRDYLHEAFVAADLLLQASAQDASEGSGKP